MVTKGISWQKNPFGSRIHYGRKEVQSTRIYQILWVSRPKLEFQNCNHDQHVNNKSKLDINTDKTKPVNKLFLFAT